jgi:hypothetical protein
MNQRQVFRWIRAIAVDLELTPTQAENLTKQQAAIYIKDNYPFVTNAQLKEAAHFWPGMKEILIRDAKERELETEVVILGAAVESFRPDVIDWQHENVQELFAGLAYLTLGGDPNDL